MFGDRNSLQNDISHMSCFEAGCQICRARDLEVLFTSMQLDLTWDARVPTKIFPKKAYCEPDFILKVARTRKRLRLQAILEVSVSTPIQSRTILKVNSSCSGYCPDGF